MIIILQGGTSDITNGEAIKINIRLVFFKFFYKIPSSNDKISCKLVSLITNNCDYLDCVHYVSDLFDINTGIWWSCDDDNITQISGLLEGVYIRESHKE